MVKNQQTFTNNSYREQRRQTKLVIPLLCILIFSIILSVNVSAVQWDNVKSTPDNFDMWKDKITIKNTFLWIWETGDVADIELISNRNYVLIEGKTRFKITLYENYRNPITNANFKDKQGSNANDNVKNIEWFYYDNSSYEVDIKDYQNICDSSIGNGTSSCQRTLLETHKETRYYNRWLEYEGGNFEKGEWLFELRAEKQRGLSVDFIPTLFGVELEEFIWWNDDFPFKRTIHSASGMSETIPYPVNVSSNVTLVNGGDAFIYSTGSNNSQNYLYYNFTNLTAVSNDTQEFWKITSGQGRESGIGVDNSGTVSANITWFLTMDDIAGGGLLVDYTGNNNGSTTGSVVKGMNGKWGKSVLFTGTNGDFVQPTTNYFPFEGQQFGTIIIFMQPAEESDVGRNAYFFGSGTNNELFCKTSAAGDWSCYVDNTQVVPDVNLGKMWEIGEWVMLAFTYDVVNDVHKIYVNKTRQHTSTTGVTAAPSATTFYLGSEGGSSNFKGNISQVMTFGRVLTSQEINDTYDGWFATPTMGDEEINVDPSPEVTLNNPPNALGTTSNNIGFNCSATDNNLIENLSLWIDGSMTDFVIDGIDNETTLNITKSLAVAEYNWTCKAYDNETIPNVGMVVNRTFTISNFIENSQSVNLSTFETLEENFAINITTIGNILSVTSILDYNGTEFLGSADCLGTNCIINTSIDIPLIGDALGDSHNISYFWNLRVFNLTGSVQQNSTTREINVTRIRMDNCTIEPIFTMNFTTYDEQNNTKLNNFSFQGTFDFWLGSGNIKRNVSFDNLSVSEFPICTGQEAINRTFIDSNIKYNSIELEYVTRDYHINELEINNITTNISLFLLLSSSSTSFILKVQDENLLPVADALIEIHRFYPGEGIFKIVQIAKTDDTGKSIGFFETETVDYKFIIKKAGVILLETGQQKVIPETSPFTLTFNTGVDLGKPWRSQDDIPSLESSLVWNKDTGFVTYIYVDTSSNFTQARLFVQQQSLVNSTAYQTICNDTSDLSSSTITCNVGNSTGFYIGSAFITRGGEALDKQISFQIESFSSVVGFLGLFFGWFLILIASMLFRFSEIAGIWAITVTIFLINLMGLISFGAVFVTAIIFIAVILTWVMSK